MIAVRFVGMFPPKFGGDKMYGYHAAWRTDQEDRDVAEAARRLISLHPGWDRDQYVFYTWDQLYEGEKEVEVREAEGNESRLVLYGYQGDTEKKKVTV